MLIISSQRVIVVGASISSHEVLHEILPQAQHPVYASIRGEPIPAFGWAPFKHPHIAVKKQISRLDPLTGKVTFADGTELNDVDHIVFGTGYTFSLPWLPQVHERIRKAYRRLPGVYQHTWDIEDPTLAFVGMVSYPRLVGMMLRLYPNKTHLPSLEEGLLFGCTSGRQWRLLDILQVEPRLCRQ
jgi:hypothetical protein